MPDKVVILGGGGHAAVVESALSQTGCGVAAVLDDSLAPGTKIIEASVAGKISQLGEFRGEAEEVHVAIGSNEARFTLAGSARKEGFKLKTIVHPTAFVDPSAKIGDGVFVAAGAFVGPRAEIGDGAIINTHASVDHDCKIGEFSHICPGTILAGAVEVGPLTTVGAGSVVKPLVKIGANDLIGSGSVVVKNIGDNTVSYGTPAEAQKINPKPRSEEAKQLAKGMSDFAKKTLLSAAVVFFAGLALALLAINFCDRDLAMLLHELPGDRLEDAGMIGQISLLCKKPYVTMVVAVFFIFFTFVKPMKEWFEKLGFFLISMGVCGIVSSLTKELFRRARPGQLFKEAAHYGFFFFDQTKNAYKSFPSGHSMEIATMAAVFWFIFPKLRPIWAVAVIWMMSDRLLMEKHFLSDTIMGATLGIVIVLLVRAFLAPPVIRLVEKIPGVLWKKRS